MDPRGSYVSKILYVKTKELGPLRGGARRARPLDPPMETLYSLISLLLKRSSNSLRPFYETRAQSHSGILVATPCDLIEVFRKTDLFCLPGRQYHRLNVLHFLPSLVFLNVFHLW